MPPWKEIFITDDFIIVYLDTNDTASISLQQMKL
jgi:hypothetical protein